MQAQELADLQAVLTRLLERFDADCAAAGAVFYLDAGVLLGAVRHEGWIPWDDDVDVCMWRRDYERLREYLRTAPAGPTVLTDPMYDKRWGPIPRYEIVGSRRTFEDQERLIGFKETGTLPLDIFVIDAAPGNPVALRVWLGLTRLLELLRLAKGIDRDRIRWQPSLARRRLMTAAWYACHAVPLKAIQRVYLWVATLFRDSGEVGYELSGGRGYRRMPVLRRWYNHQVRFEGRTYNAPDPHPYLSLRYGPDYIVPPPIEKRTAHLLTGIYAELDGLRVDTRATSAT